MYKKKYISITNHLKYKHLINIILHKLKTPVTIGIVVFTAMYIVNRINPSQIIQVFQTISFEETNTIQGIGFLIVMGFFNILIESIKWKNIINTIHTITLIESLKSVLSGITIGIITPNRIGELPTRILYINKSLLSKTLHIILSCSFIQTLVTVIMGLIAILSIILWYGIAIIQGYTYIIAISLFFFLIIFIILVKRSAILKKILTFETFPVIRKLMVGFGEIPRRNLVFMFRMGVLRYVLYILQFHILLQIVGVDISLFQTICGVGIMYLISTIIPSFTFIDELGIRVGTAIGVLAIFTGDSNAVAIASIGLWSINIAFPALIGGIFLLQRNKVCSIENIQKFLLITNSKKVKK
ncbi:MAG: lysylphosphatidylglycerol synthase domain-containing protein [Bacteroidales bacterium]